MQHGLAAPAPAITARVLPPVEWIKLDGTALAGRWRDLDPASAQVLVAEQGGDVVGWWVALNVVHVEGLGIVPSHQGLAGVSRALLRAMTRELQAHGVREVVAHVTDPAVAEMVAGLGGLPLPGEAWVVPVGASDGD